MKSFSKLIKVVLATLFILCVFSLGKLVLRDSEYNYSKNNPILPPQLFLRSDKDIFVYKKSLLSTIDNSSNFGITLTSNVGSRKIIDIQEPTGLGVSSIDNPAMFVVQQSTASDKLVYKNVQIFKKDVSTLEGKSISVLGLGDSLFEGMSWESTPICMLSDALEEVGVTTRFIGTLGREDFINRKGEKQKINYEGHGAWRYRTFVGLESKFSSLNVIIPTDQTKSEWRLGVDGSTMNEIKANNPFLFPATKNDLNTYPEWCFHFVEENKSYNKSYKENSSLGNYHIFDPNRYFSLRNIEKPDVLIMAIGTNEWYLNMYGGFDVEKATSCFDFMITRFRQALPSTKIVVIPAQTMMVGRDKIWKEKYSKLCASIMLAAENKILSGDENLFVCPIYAQGSRFLAFDNFIDSVNNINEHNSTKEVLISQDVHYMYKNDDESNNDYVESLAACVVNIIE